MTYTSVTQSIMATFECSYDSIMKDIYVFFLYASTEYLLYSRMSLI